MNKCILITFDYELFLGEKSGSINHCLIEPTKRLLSTFKKNEVKPAIFFVDTTYLIQLENQIARYPRAEKDYLAIRSQLIDILRDGHILFIHLHPHWIDADYDPSNNEWSLTNYRYYRFHNLEKDQKAEIFANSVRILEEIQDEAGIHYPLNGYRAGGWSLTPFCDFKPYFDKYGINYDFSVISRSFDHTTAQDYDYRDIKGLSWYLFNNEVIQAVKNGQFCEHPISTIRISHSRDLIDKVWRKIFWKLGYKSLGNGIGVKPKFLDIDNQDQNYSYIDLSIENLLPSTINPYKNYINNHNYIQFLSHPKMVSKINLYYWNKLLRWIQKNHDVNYHYKVPEFELSEQNS